MEQPLDFSVKSESVSPGGDSFYSQSSSRSKVRGSSNGSIIKDEQYYLRREKNNAAAKRSRDARRQKEEQTKHENQLLREENERLKNSVKCFKEHLQVCPYPRTTFGGKLKLELDS